MLAPSMPMQNPLLCRNVSPRFGLLLLLLWSPSTIIILTGFSGVLCTLTAAGVGASCRVLNGAFIPCCKTEYRGLRSGRASALMAGPPPYHSHSWSHTQAGTCRFNHKYAGMYAELLTALMPSSRSVSSQRAGTQPPTANNDNPPNRAEKNILLRARKQPTEAQHPSDDEGELMSKRTHRHKVAARSQSLAQPRVNDTTRVKLIKHKTHMAFVRCMQQSIEREHERQNKLLPTNDSQRHSQTNVMHFCGQGTLPAKTHQNVGRLPSFRLLDPAVGDGSRSARHRLPQRRTTCIINTTYRPVHTYTPNSNIMHRSSAPRSTYCAGPIRGFVRR